MNFDRESILVGSKFSDDQHVFGTHAVEYGLDGLKSAATSVANVPSGYFHGSKLSRI